MHADPAQRPASRLIGLFLSLLLVLGTGRAFAQPGIGDLSPELGLEALLNAPEGSEATLEGLRGKIVVLEFWATWCGPCVGAIPHLNELYAEHRDKGVVFISVTDEDRETVERFQETEPAIDNWIGLDTDRSLHDAFAIRGIPTTIVLDGYGRVAARTHPTRLNSELMSKFLTGHRETPRVVTDRSGDRPRTVNKLFELLAGPITAGVDPLDASETSEGARFVLRPSQGNPGNMSVATSGQTITGIGMGVRHIAGYLYPDAGPLIDVSAFEGDERRFDLVVSQSFPTEMIVPLILEAMGASVSTETREVDACRLVLAPGGLLNTSELEKETGWSTSYDVDKGVIVLDSANMRVADLARLLESRLGMPCVDATGVGDERVRLRLEMPRGATPELLTPILESSLGLRLEPVRVEREVTVLEPMVEGDG